MQAVLHWESDKKYLRDHRPKQWRKRACTGALLWDLTKQSSLNWTCGRGDPAGGRHTFLCNRTSANLSMHLRDTANEPIQARNALLSSLVSRVKPWSAARHDQHLITNIDKLLG